jgi:two-component system sensor histidine kinase/response regulator
MDLQMPVMGGLDATRAIRQDLGLHDLPVVAMTANAMASDREACLAAGMNDHIGKPFDLNHLVQILVHHTQWEPADPAGLAATHHQISTPDAPPAVDWPESIDGAAALVRMGGNAGLLAKTMQAFARDASRFPDKIAALMAGGDAASLQLELHSFKGLSATLGIGELSRLAAKAEGLVKQAGALVQAHEPLLALMEQVRAQIAATLPLLESLAGRMVPQKERVPQPVPASSEFDASVAMRQLRHLREVLHNSDMVAMELHATLRLTATEIPDADWEPLDGAMAELDFDLAAQECDVLIATLAQ